MKEKSLAQMIRERMDGERESCIDAEVKRQWDMVMGAIDAEASAGNYIVDYPRVSFSGYEGEACHIVCDKLKENGFRVEYNRGIWVSW